jgi:hypothetical protein
MPSPFDYILDIDLPGPECDSCARRPECLYIHDNIERLHSELCLPNGALIALPVLALLGGILTQVEGSPKYVTTSISVDPNKTPVVTVSIWDLQHLLAEITRTLLAIHSHTTDPEWLLVRALVAHMIHYSNLMYRQGSLIIYVPETASNPENRAGRGCLIYADSPGLIIGPETKQ